MLKSFIHRLQMLFAATLRRQLIFGVAFVHAVMMTLFVWDLTERQKDLLLERQVEQAQALARSMATSSAGWVASRDLYGLQEIVTAQARYPELQFAMIVDRDGQVLAHTDTVHVGFFLKDFPPSPESTIIAKTAALVDAASPVILADRFIGWVRIGLGQQQTAKRMSQIVLNGLLYALLAIIIGSVLAWFMGVRLTRKLQNIQLTADAVVQGNLLQRTGLQGSDEVSHVAMAFDHMLDSLQDSMAELEKSEERFDLAMYASNDGLWDWDIKHDCVYYSPRWKQMLGYAEEEIGNTFDDWQKLVHPDDLSRTMRFINDCREGRARGFEIEFRMHHANGQWLNILSRATLVTDDRGQTIRMVGTHSDVTDKREKEKIIWQQANYDSLTGLPNRKLFRDLLEQMIHLSQSTKQNTWVLFLDLDGFNIINDTLGHDYGDRLLVMVAQRLESILQKGDVLGRFGGDEFVIMLEHLDDLTQVDLVAGRLLEVLSQPFQMDAEGIYISASIGISGCPVDGTNADDLLKFAEQSMYSAKDSGKNRFSFFTPDMQQAALMRVQLSTEIRQALKNGEFRLCYQPIVETSSQQVNKAEALIRWLHPEKGLISPGVFIPIAEETGTIGEIGDWVLAEAIRQIKQWQLEYQRTMQISVNMSPYQLKIPDARHDGWIDTLFAEGLDGNAVVLEITEGILLKNDTHVKQRLLHYRDQGVQVAIDDFGTGYSSLAYLKEFDIDFLKIDQSFIRRMEEGNSDHALSEAIIVMAHKLGLRVIAEGVEFEHQVEMLKKMDCDFIQGYFYARPLAPGDFAEAYLAGQVLDSHPA